MNLAPPIYGYIPCYNGIDSLTFFQDSKFGRHRFTSVSWMEQFKYQFL